MNIITHSDVGYAIVEPDKVENHTIRRIRRVTACQQVRTGP
jgi:hypothetical protein